MRPRSCANRYWRARLAKSKGNDEETGAMTAKGLIGEVRGDRAGRTPGNTVEADQSFSTTSSTMEVLIADPPAPGCSGAGWYWSRSQR